jgi:hypothetical protein
VRAQDELIASSMSLPQLVRFYVVAFLTRAALFARRSDRFAREAPPPDWQGFETLTQP